MDSLVFATEKVLPLLIMMAVGYAAKLLRVMDERGVRQANNAVFRVFLPLSLCLSIMDTSAATVMDVKTIVYAVAATVLAFLLLLLIVPRFCKQRSAVGVLVQGVMRSNYAIFGIPLAGQLYGDTSLAALMVVVVVPTFNVLSVIVLTIYGDKKADIKQIVKGIVTNPLIIGTALGFVLWKLNVTLPPLLSSPLHTIASIATPLALFLLGASLDFSKAYSNKRLLAFGVLGRLVVMPVVCLLGAVALGIRDMSLAALIAVFASPTAVSSYPMAQQMGGDADLAAAQVAFSAALSIVTIFLVIFALKELGWIANFPT